MSAPHYLEVESDDESANEENVGAVGQLSEYEKKIQQNVAERNKVFQLMVSEAKNDFMTMVEQSSSEKPMIRKICKRKKESVRYLSIYL